MRNKFEIIEHTADVGIAAYGTISTALARTFATMSR